MFQEDKLISWSGLSKTIYNIKKWVNSITHPLTFKYKDSKNQPIETIIDGKSDKTIDISDGVYYATTSTTATRVSNPITIINGDEVNNWNGSAGLEIDITKNEYVNEDIYTGELYLGEGVTINAAEPLTDRKGIIKYTDIYINYETNDPVTFIKNDGRLVKSISDYRLEDGFDDIQIVDNLSSDIRLEYVKEINIPKTINFIYNILRPEVILNNGGVLTGSTNSYTEVDFLVYKVKSSTSNVTEAQGVIPYNVINTETASGFDNITKYVSGRVDEHVTVPIMIELPVDSLVYFRKDTLMALIDYDTIRDIKSNDGLNDNVYTYKYNFSDILGNLFIEDKFPTGSSFDDGVNVAFYPIGMNKLFTDVSYSANSGPGFKYGTLIDDKVNIHGDVTINGNLKWSMYDDSAHVSTHLFNHHYIKYVNNDIRFVTEQYHDNPGTEDTMHDVLLSKFSVGKNAIGIRKIPLYIKTVFLNNYNVLDINDTTDTSGVIYELPQNPSIGHTIRFYNNNLNVIRTIPTKEDDDPRNYSRVSNNYYLSTNLKGNGPKILLPKTATAIYVDDGTNVIKDYNYLQHHNNTNYFTIDEEKKYYNLNIYDSGVGDKLALACTSFELIFDGQNWMVR